MDCRHLTDEQLVEKIRASDPELYSEIINRYQAKLSHYLKKFISHESELEDVLQEVFIKTYKNLYGFDIEKKFSSWIFRITHNEAINNIKKRKKELLILDEAEWQIIDEKMNLEKEVEREIDCELIEQALLKIKLKYREPLILFFLEEKSYEEISEILRIPVSTVGVLILRGKKKLQQYLSK
jgi:RNA polymerase sigma-70 factor, ECF subfamily